MSTETALDGKPYAGNPHVRFDECLQTLSKATGAAEPFAFDEEGRCTFAFDEDMGVAILRDDDPNDESANGVVVCILIGRPDLSDANLLAALLAGNYMTGLSGGGSLALDNGVLVVHRRFEASIEPATFVEAFAALAGAARYWKARMDGQGGGDVLPMLSLSELTIIRG